MNLEGFKSFKKFKKHMLKEFPPCKMDLELSGGAGGGGHRDMDTVWIYPPEGGAIILRKNGTWGWDVAPFSD